MSNKRVISELTLNSVKDKKVCQYYERQGIDFKKLDVGTQVALWEIWNIRDGYSVSVEIL